MLQNKSQKCLNCFSYFFGQYYLQLYPKKAVFGISNIDLWELYNKDVGRAGWPDTQGAYPASPVELGANEWDNWQIFYIFHKGPK